MDGGIEGAQEISLSGFGRSAGEVVAQDATSRACGLIAIGCALRFAGEGEPVAGGAGKQKDI
jgi:hypothetical protein